MNCREFRQYHVAFVDGMTDEGRTEDMYGHLGQCSRCERLDTAVRRALLVAKNLPMIHASSDFMLRLETRLRGQTMSKVVVPTSRRGLRVEFGVVAAVLALASAITGGLFQRHRPQRTAAVVMAVQNAGFSGPEHEIFTTPIPTAGHVVDPDGTARVFSNITVLATNLSP
jgi:anti-sigma factor RsiW